MRHPRGWVLMAGAIGLVVPLLAQAAGPDAAALDALLAQGSLEKTRNPVPASFVLNEGGSHLTGAERTAALDQLRNALEVQTNVLRMMTEGGAEMMNSDSVQQQVDYAQKHSGKGSMVKSLFGIHQAPPPVNGQQMQQEMKQAMVDPWVRGIEAARALEEAGDAQGAANFYVNCLQMLQADWVPSACMDGILDLGPRRAGLVLDWMLDNAEAVSLTGGGGFAPPPPTGRGAASPDRGALQLRLAALEGLGALVGSGQLAAGDREQIFSKLLAYSGGKQNEPYFRGAALGLGRSRDPRAAEPLRRLAKDSRPEVRDAAWRGLAISFHDDAAIRGLRSQLDDHDLQDQLRAAEVLFEIGDETALRWAVDTLGQRRTSDAKQPDVRPQVVRQLVALAGPRARQTLERALAAGTGNDWLEAWVRVALLELGDRSQLPWVESALAKEDWALDPRGFLSIWRAIKPLLLAVAQTAFSGGAAAPSAFHQAQQAVQLVGNFASGERGRYLASADQRRAAIARLRWQTADALAAAHPPGAAKILIGLLDDPTPAVRLSAAHALACLDEPEAIDGLVIAYGREYGEEGGISRTAEVRGALLRATLIRFSQDPRARRLLGDAESDPDPGVRFIALASLQPVR